MAKKKLATPKTRLEEFLYKIARGETSGLPNPVSRIEEYLKAIAEKDIGNVSPLPAVTGDDDGKVLMVSDGAWGKGNVAGGGGGSSASAEPDYFIRMYLTNAPDNDESGMDESVETPFIFDTSKTMDELLAGAQTGSFTADCKLVTSVDFYGDGSLIVNSHSIWEASQIGVYPAELINSMFEGYDTTEKNAIILHLRYGYEKKDSSDNYKFEVDCLVYDSENEGSVICLPMGS